MNKYFIRFKYEIHYHVSLYNGVEIKKLSKEDWVIIDIPDADFNSEIVLKYIEEFISTLAKPKNAIDSNIHDIDLLCMSKL